MNAARENTPLVELVAEARWLPNGLPEGVAGVAGVPLMQGPDNRTDEFFMRFGAAVAGSGYSSVERLFSPVQVLYQPVFRFKKPADANDSSLYQVGPGLFTANALPPYESWEKFGPVVRDGVRALLASRPRGEEAKDFLSASLRYIDAFRDDHTGGRDIHSFMQEVMGIEVNVPDSVTKNLAPGAKLVPVLQLQVPMRDGLEMSLSIGQGMWNGSVSIMMDTSVSTTLPIQASEGALMAAFDSGHASIRETFFGLMGKIMHVMPPKAKAAQ